MQSGSPDPRHNRCRKCNGTLVYAEDRYDPYVQCLHCGRLIDLLATEHSAPMDEPDRPASRVVRNRGRLAGPMTPERRQMYRGWCAIIRKEGLTVTQAAERFGVSYRTIYRILKGSGRTAPKGKTRDGQRAWTQRQAGA